MKVYLTIDIECRLDASVRTNGEVKPIGHEAILCPDSFSKENHGLPFLLEIFDKYKIPASFFIETMQTSYYGNEMMAEYAKQIQSHGHELGLHTHPAWSFFDSGGQPSDDCAVYDYEDLRAMIRNGKDFFQQNNLGDVRLFRSGGLSANHVLFKALHDEGIFISSTTSSGYGNTQDIPIYENGIYSYDGVWEFPIFSYRNFPLLSPSRKQILSITGIGTSELETLIRTIRKDSIEHIVMITHPFEFIKPSRENKRICYENKINKERLEYFISHGLENGLEFVLFPRLEEIKAIEEKQVKLFDYHAFSSKVENKLNDLMITDLLPQYNSKKYK